MHIIGNVEHEPLLAERYDIDIDAIPNIAMDVVVPWLASALPLNIAARIFLGFCVVLTLASVAYRHRTLFNHWSPHTLIAALFAYHGSLIAGMANFSLAIGLVPGALAIWIRLQEKRAAWRLFAGCTLTLLLFFCHLVAFSAYGLLVIGYFLAYARDQWHREDRSRLIGSELVIAGTTGLLPLILLLRIMLDSEPNSASAGIVYGNIAWKLKAALSPLANYSLALDLVSFLLLAGLVLIGWSSKLLLVDRRMVPGLALLAAAFVLAPKALWTGGVFDQRLAVLLALMLVASTQAAKPLAKGRERLVLQAVPAMLALLFLARMGVLTSAWLDHREDLAEMRRAIDLTTKGSRILVVLPDKEAGQRIAPPRHRVFHHAVQLQSLPTLAVLEKSAFVSTLYALPGQQPLILRPPFDQLGGQGHVDLPTLKDLQLAYQQEDPGPKSHRLIQNWTTDFDYIVMIYGYGTINPTLTNGLPVELLLDGKILDLFRIKKVL